MAVKVYSKATQQVVEVPSSEAQRGLLAGDYVAPEGQQLRVAKGTKTGRVAPADLLVALGQGARLIDEDEAEKITIKREESDLPSQMLGTLEAGAAGASLGLTTALEAALGVDPERMAARREALDHVGTAAEIGGAIASGGAGLAAKTTAGAAKYGVGALVSRGSRGIERMVGRELAETGAGAGVRAVVPAATGQFVEGIGYAAGSELDEAVLGRRPIAVEHILGGGLMSGALGGVLGLAAPGMSKIIEGTGKLPAAAARKVGDSVSGAMPSMPKDFGEIAAAGARVTAKATGGDESKLLELASWATTPEKRARAFRIAHDPDAVMKEVSDDVLGAVTEVRGALDDVVPELSRASKLKHVEKKLPKDGNDAARIEAAKKILDDYEDRIAELMDYNAKTSYATFKQGDLERARAFAQKARVEINGALSSLPGARPAGRVDYITGRRIEAPPTRTAADAYRALNQLKQAIDESNAARNLFSKTDAQVADTFSAMSGVQGRLRKHLEDEKIWGAAGAAQAKLNAKITASMAARAELGSRASVLGRVMDRSKTVDPSDILALAKSTGRLKGDVKAAKLDDYLDTELDYLKTARELFELDSGMLVKINGAEKAIERMRKTLAQRAEDARLIDLDQYARKLESGGSPSMGMYSTIGPAIGDKLASGLGAGVGALVGGLPGAIAGGAVGGVAGVLVGSVTRPHTAFRTLVALAHKADKHGMALDAAVGRFLGRMRNAGQRADGIGAKIERGAKRAGELAGAATRSAGRAAGRAAAVAASKADGDTRAERKVALTKLRSRVLQLATQPGRIADELALPLSHIAEHAPMLADLITSKTQVAAEFLASKVPATYEAPFGNGRPIVNSVEQAKWERYVAVVENPLVVVDLMNDGNLTKEHVEALFVVYPEIHKSIVDSVWAEFAAARDEGRTVPFSARVKAAQLLDLPTDPVYTPEVISRVQSVWAPTAQEQKLASKGPGRPPKSSKPGENTLTPAQKTEV